MVNINKLKGKIVENGYNISVFAKMLNIDKATFYRKLAQDGETFSVKEAGLICEKLKLKSDEAVSIFFSDLVA